MSRSSGCLWGFVMVWEVMVRRRVCAVAVVLALAVAATGCLHEVDGLVPRADASAFDINDAGMIVGESPTSAGPRHAFARVGEGPAIDLTPEVATHTTAHAVNSAGVVAGVIDAGGTGDRVFVWSGETGLDVLDSPP